MYYMHTYMYIHISNPHIKSGDCKLTVLVTNTFASRGHLWVDHAFFRAPALIIRSFFLFHFAASALRRHICMYMYMYPYVLVHICMHVYLYCT